MPRLIVCHAPVLYRRVAKEASGKYKTAMCDILENV